jgi:peroxiredoxin
MQRLTGWILVGLLSFGFPAWAGDLAPEFKGRDVNGNVHTLADYAGKHTVLYFWATWCPGCVRDIPNVKRLFAEYQPEGVEFVTVSLDRDIEKLRRFLKKHKIEFTVLFDGKGWKNEIANLYGVEGTPSFVVISPDGYVSQAGYWSTDLRAILESLKL